MNKHQLHYSTMLGRETKPPSIQLVIESSIESSIATTTAANPSPNPNNNDSNTSSSKLSSMPTRLHASIATTTAASPRPNPNNDSTICSSKLSSMLARLHASIATTTAANPRPNPNNGSTTSSKLSSMLARLHAGYFRISLSFGSQALLWKILRQTYIHNHSTSEKPSPILDVFHILPSTISHLFWCLSLLILILISLFYILRCFFHFHLVKAELLHYVGVNYLFAPWISWLLLLQSTPKFITPNTVPYLILWWTFSIPIIVLDLKIYGQWFTTEKKFLSMVANPTSQLSVLGNLVGARAAAQMGWKESAVCMFSLGMAHYLVLFVTLYQRLCGGDRLPAMLRPVFFLFFAVPSMASLAWSSISGSFDTDSKMLFFLSLFLFASLVSRPTLFKKSMRKFNIAWWAYSFPLSMLALASAEYAQQVKGHTAAALMLIISALSFIVFIGLMLFTLLNVTKLLRENDPILSFAKDPMA